MAKVQQLGYIGIEARDVDAWRLFAQQVLGLEVVHGGDEAQIFLKMDGYHHRFTLHASERDDVSYVGWDVGSEANMAALAGRLDAAGVAVISATPNEVANRRVLDFVHFVDPHSGVRTELHYGPEVVFMPPFQAQRAITGFKTGNLGLGHFVTFVGDIEAAAHFYEDVLGFGMSDWIVVPGMGRVGAFMHCNERHHSLAFFAHPKPTRHVHHVMIEHTSIDDVGQGYDICLERNLVTATLGRHLNDHMVSFYFKSPGGWHFEMGWGARTIEPSTWQVEHYNGLQPGGGEWGHDGLSAVM